MLKSIKSELEKRDLTDLPTEKLFDSAVEVFGSSEIRIPHHYLFGCGDWQYGKHVQ